MFDQAVALASDMPTCGPHSVVITTYSVLVPSTRQPMQIKLTISERLQNIANSLPDCITKPSSPWLSHR